MAERAKCRVRLSVTNEGKESVRPELQVGHFTVDGEASMLLDLSFGNGVMGPDWLSLAPGKTAITERALCEDIFPAPGRYTVGFVVGAVTTSASARVTRDVTKPAR